MQVPSCHSLPAIASVDKGWVDAHTGIACACRNATRRQDNANARKRPVSEGHRRSKHTYARFHAHANHAEAVLTPDKSTFKVLPAKKGQRSRR